LAAPAVVHGQIFELFEAMQVDLQLGVAPTGVLADVSAAKEKIGAAVHQRFDQQEQLACLRRQFVERAAQ
jgi:hypothetical protein